AGWQVRDKTLVLDRPIIVGVLNVTPDSFSDGGLHLTLDAARRHADEIVSLGADAVDIGGESTRPQGAARVSAAEELRRVMPVVTAVRRAHPHLPISVDTTKSEVARVVLEAGADIINDVAAGRLDSAMFGVVAAANAGIILMHSRGDVESMARYELAVYGDDPVGDVVRELRECATRALESGVARERIVLDPGIGFAKRTAHSVAMLAGLGRISALGYPVLVGASRKRMVGELSGVTDPRLRLAGSLGAHVAALMRGARLFRVHDVKAHREALTVAWAVLNSAAGR
ncbi:MAG: dihydropteroate synthase, partial [Gemmatimonadaceae bacterium]